MANNKFTIELYDELLAKLFDAGLRLKFKKEIGQELRLQFSDEAYKLSPALQNKAFKLVAEKQSAGWAVDFAEQLVTELETLLESDSKSEQAKGTITCPDSGEETEPDIIGESNDSNGNHSAGIGSPGDNQSVEQIVKELRRSISLNKSAFEFSDKSLVEMAEKLARDGEKIKKSFGLTDEQLIGLANVSLYDIFFLCDDSSSMHIGERLPIMSRTLQSVADWACRLEPRGISMRFLNFEADGSFNNLTDLKAIQEACFQVKNKLKARTQLGTVLKKKILELRKKKFSLEGAERPLIVAIITDGEPHGEPRDALEKAMQECREEENGLSTVFLIFQVGHDKMAKRFIADIGQSVGNEILYCSNKRGTLDDIADKISLPLEDNNITDADKLNLVEYKRAMLDEFINAIINETDHLNQEPKL